MKKFRKALSVFSTTLFLYIAYQTLYEKYALLKPLDEMFSANVFSISQNGYCDVLLDGLSIVLASPEAGDKTRQDIAIRYLNEIPAHSCYVDRQSNAIAPRQRVDPDFLTSWRQRIINDLGAENLASRIEYLERQKDRPIDDNLLEGLPNHVIKLFSKTIDIFSNYFLNGEWIYFDYFLKCEYAVEGEPSFSVYLSNKFIETNYPAHVLTKYHVRIFHDWDRRVENCQLEEFVDRAMAKRLDSAPDWPLVQ